MDAASRPSNIGVLLEQTLGHVSHGRNLQDTLTKTDLAVVRCLEVPYEPRGVLDRFPPRSNWTVRSSLAARSAVRSLQRSGPLDALFVHTHVPATLLGSTMARIPTVISIDATPKQIDSLGGSYQHQVHPGMVESAKWHLHARCFRRASSLVAWSKWAADSLVSDYGVNRNRIEVIPPGVVPSQWMRSEPKSADGDTLRILFVGGDFTRKGGEILVEAFQRLQNDPEVLATGKGLELHLVTGADVKAGKDLFVYNGLTPNSPELIELFHRCDVFALPTLGDCTPLVLAEAASAGLPAVATNVGGIGESVIEGVTGHLVEPNVESLAHGLRRLLVDADHRLRLGRQATEHAFRNMDSEKNALRLLDGLIESAKGERGRSRVVLTVSGEVPEDTEFDIATGKRPLADYQAISKAADATLLDWSRLRTVEGPITDSIRRLGGNSLALAYHFYKRRREFDVVVTDGEQIGLPLAALLAFNRERSLKHVMIGHRLSPLKKTLPARLLRTAHGVDEILVYSTTQYEVASKLFNRPNNVVRLIDFMVDSEFFRPTRPVDVQPESQRPLILTAGREFRDYPTFIEAVRGLDVDVVIASASPWSKRSDNAHTVELPPNVQVTALTQLELRNKLDETSLLVLPLLPTDFQAGITTILEAMAMERPVICTATSGQTDVIEDGVNGRYVPPGDVEALRATIQELIADPERAAEMGLQGRKLVERRADVRVYADLFADIVQTHLTV